MSSNSLEQLITLFAKMPGLGPRSARRVTLHLIKNRYKLMKPLHDLLGEVMQNVVHCRICNNLDIYNPCQICLDENRDKSQICIVEEIGDLWAIDKGGIFNGMYHVLGGTLSAIDGIGPEHLSIDLLVRRVAEGEIEEVILANNATIEGKTTAHYITDLLKPYNVKISQLAYGIPVGGEIDYLDEHTLSAALKARNYVEG
ncbi:recombination mediator RecR [Rickettsiales endosymbiont of Stachyamoeba lipophora]|uniref:recombination mediator RecR n=1 Tax=Rickettsiales endosymbiont of Stachyamoeba lipophora TaxID=2486578 RepID=UPI000F64F96B|nr:recombination mediator RecR [Rickettsiales endosymbiont of Stachyamoeba lipophora]AZL16227.1 recombination protein RecR [Rickettsiales endosymbiont of Stachyamoeba lipophora]